MRNTDVALLAAAGLCLALPSPALAYLNPDTGSMLLQVLLAGAAGLAVAGKLLWGRLVGLFGRRRTRATGSEE